LPSVAPLVACPHDHTHCPCPASLPDSSPSLLGSLPKPPPAAPLSPVAPPPPSPSPPVSPPPPPLCPSCEITYYYTHRSCPALTPDSSLSILGSHDSPPRYALRDHRTLRPPDRLGFTAAVLAEPKTYREAAAHQEWQHAMAEEIAALERTGT
jgi:hypothetical protein